MKHSLQNDTGLRATLPTNYPGEGNNKGLPKSGPASAPQEKLLSGKLASFKNAENDSAPILVSYNSPDYRKG
jgi:hypothetical protein